MRSAALEFSTSQRVVSSHRLALLIGSAVLLTAPLVLLQPAAYWADDPELFRLLRGMAMLKFVLAAIGFAAAWWRLGGQPSVHLQTAYVGGVWSLSLAAGLIWQLQWVIPASALFHAATLALLFAAWRDMEPLNRTSAGIPPPASIRTPRR